MGDNEDAFDNDPLETKDTDGDGIGDNSDPFPLGNSDTDGDGVFDRDDDFDNDPFETTDTDGDGVGDNADEFDNDPTETTDTDGDGVGDNEDAFDNDPSETTDTDGDGTGDNSDDFINDPSETTDTDGDGTGDNADDFIDDPSETTDSDGDGVGDNSDVFDNDPTETRDSDNDGIGDNSDPFPFGELPPDADDRDNDGVIDTLDAFPDDASEWLDSDGDGVGNREDDFDNDPTETVDTDGDGVGDNADVFPDDATEQSDLDGDGIGDSTDNDSDNDNTPDSEDAFPLDSAESADSDLDGVGDIADIDDDNDGYLDSIERLFGSDPLDIASLPEGLDVDRDSLSDQLERGSDADGDGIGNEFDVDSDGDGIFDLIEANTNPFEAAALDSDGDGMMDAVDMIGLLRITEPADTDRDGISDFRDLDSDNDGIADAMEASSSTVDFMTINNLQNDLTPGAPIDTDGDLLVNYRDLDSDNDGIPDLVEAGGTDTDINGLVDDFRDFNADGMDDGFFFMPLNLADSDNDEILDYLDLDSDNDGVFDSLTSGLSGTVVTVDGRLDITTDSDGDGIFDYADVTFTNGVDSDGDGIDDRVDASVLGETDTDSDGIADQYDADSQGDGFIELGIITLPDNTPPTVEAPVIAPATPEAVVTTSLNGGGCSVSGPAHPDMTLTALLIFAFIYLTLLHIGTLAALKRVLLVFISTALAAGPTVADVNTGLYLGIGGGASQLTPGVENVELTSRDSVSPAWHATAGYQLSRTLGVELEYSNLGTTTLDPVGDIDYQDINVSGLYHWGGAASPSNGKKYSLYGRLGVGTINNQSSVPLRKGNSSHLVAGAGVQMPVNANLSLRAEAVNFDADVSRAGLSLVYAMGPRSSIPPIEPIASNSTWNVNKDRATINSDAGNELPTLPTLSLTSTDTAETKQEDGSMDTTAPVPFSLIATGNASHTDSLPTIAEAMTVAPEVKKRWMVSESTLMDMHGKSDSNLLETNDSESSAQTSDDKLQMSAALDVPALSMDESDSTSMSDNAQASDTNTLDMQPAMQAAMPIEETVAEGKETYEPVLFGFNQSSVTSDMASSLQPLVDHLSATPDAAVTLTGHTDNIGSDEYNQALSIRRAEAVRKFLLKQGIDREMIRLMGMGEKRPVKSNAQPSGRKSNRRVNIVVD